MVWRRELAAAQLGHRRPAAGADDEDLLLAPFTAAGHGELIIAVAVVVVVTVGVVVGVVSGSGGVAVAVASAPKKIALVRNDAKVELEADSNCCRAAAVDVVALLELLLELLPGCCAATTRGSRKRALRCSARAQTVAVWRRSGVFVGGDLACGGAAGATSSNKARPDICLLRFEAGFFSLGHGLVSLLSGSSENTLTLMPVTGPGVSCTSDADVVILCVFRHYVFYFSSWSSFIPS